MGSRKTSQFRLTPFSLLIVIEFCSLGTFAGAAGQRDSGQRGPESRKVALKDVPRTVKTDAEATAGASAYFELSSVQAVRPLGIRGSVVIVNQGVRTIRLHDPKYFVILEILTADGRPVRPSKDAFFELLVHRTHDPGQYAKPISLGVGEEYRIPIETSEIFPIGWEPPREPKVAGRDEKSVAPRPVPIPAGRYKVRVSMTLSSVNPSAANGHDPPRSMRSDWVDVVLGREQ